MNEKDIFNKFSENARRILVSAQKLAKSMGTALGSEHILLALAMTNRTLSQNILKEQMVSLDQIRLVISLQNFQSRPSSGITSEAKEALQIAGKTALEFGHSQIDSEHLLSAVLSRDYFHASEVVDRIGVAPQMIRDQVEDFFEDLESIENQKTDLNRENFNPPEMPSMPIPEMMPPIPQKPVDSFFSDLNKLAEEGKIDPVIGRDREIERLIQILGRRTKNNPVLVGDPGVGKTAIVEGLARRIFEKKVPSQFLNKKVVMLDLASIVAGTIYRGQFEERIKKVIDELIKRGDTILFIDEIHTIVGAGSAESSLDAANIIKPALAKGKLRLIGATTFDEYRKVIEKDSALERRFQKITVDEPTQEETIAILNGVKSAFEKHHQVKISDEAVRSAVALSVRYIPDRFLPDKAIDLIDEAASAWQISHQDKDNEVIKKLEAQIEQVRVQKDKEVLSENFEQAFELRNLETRLIEQLEALKKAKPENVFSGEIGHEEIAKVLSLWTNIPAESLKKEDKKRFLNLAKSLRKYIVGQSEAIEAVAAAIQRTKTGIADPNRPIGSFIFLGPTGVGKTELARSLAHEIFGSRDALIKIDMSEFMEHHNVSRLVGAPPGYVGYEEAGRLTEQIRKKPYSIVLFDEIEKADSQVFNLLLQILEDGDLTDGQGRKINFRNTVIIMTSNLGLELLNQQAEIGFTTRSQKTFQKGYDNLKEELIKNLKEEFRPEFLNRIDKVVVFKPLSKNEILKIAQLQLKRLKLRLELQNIYLKITPAVEKKIASEGYDPKYGARPIRRAIAELIENPLAEKILANSFVLNDQVQVDLKNDKIVLEKINLRKKEKWMPSSKL